MMLEIVSALCAIVVFMALMKPRMFEFLMDKESGMPSQGRQGQYVALIVSTWVLVYFTMKSNLPEWFGSGYLLAWAGAQFGSVWLKLKGQTSSTSTTTTTDTTTTVAAKPKVDMP